MNLIGKQCCYMGERVCRVMRTVISSPSDLIWDESATLSIFEGGLRHGEGNSSKACLGTDAAFSPNWIVSDSIFNYKLNKRQCFAKLRRNQTLHLVTVLPGTVDFSMFSTRKQFPGCWLFLLARRI